MSFYDAPLVDKNAEKCEESITALRVLFSNKNNFVLREESPDYGVDLDIEILKSNNNGKKDVTGIKFPIQAKSTKNINIKNDFIMLQFSTSRLGYLTRRNPPYYGIITLYDENAEITYYDYVENIIARIEENRSNDWKNQDNINIHFPIQNILSAKELDKIKNKYIQRWENTVTMQNQQGKKYGIPYCVDSKEIEDIDPIAILKKHGLNFINAGEFSIIYTLIKKANEELIEQDANLCFCALVACTECGFLIDAYTYLRRTKQHIKKNMYEQERIEIITLKECELKFQLGDYSFDEYIKYIKQISNFFTTPINKLNIKSKYLYLNILSSARLQQIDFDFQNQLMDFFSEIQNSILTENQKIWLTLWHTDNFLIYTDIALTEKEAKLQTKLNFGAPINEIETQAIRDNYTALRKFCYNNISKVLCYAEQQRNWLLLATIITILEIDFVKHYSNLFIFKKAPSFCEKIKKEFQTRKNNLLSAVNIFQLNNQYTNIRQSLITLIELEKLFFRLYSQKLEGVSLEDAKNKLSKIEDKTGHKPFEFDSDKMLQEIQETSQLSPEEQIASMTDDYIDFAARSVFENHNLPMERLPNLIAEMKDRRIFYQKNKNRNIEICTKNTSYEEKTLYILVNMKTKRETSPSKNINELLDMLPLLE